jgi:tight adherence protein C
MQTHLQYVLVGLIGLSVFSLLWFAYLSWRNKRTQERLKQIKVSHGASYNKTSFFKPQDPKRIAIVIDILSKLSVPEDGWQNSKIQLRLLRAGIRNKNAAQYYFAIKTLLTFVLPSTIAAFLFITQPELSTFRSLFVVILTAAVGYYLPELVLTIVTSKRSLRMRNGLPDMIDLMVICTESGMSVDAAISHISKEMVRSNPDLSEEFYLSALEMRAGAGRIEALKNLALRAGLEDLNDLVSMLVQADKFGTSLAESLRIQSDMMRTRRAQRAEELAAKIPVKMLLPMVMFIFPTIMIVLLGPAVIQVIQVFSK